MNGAISGEEAGKRPYSAKAQANANSSAGCSFCWFVLSVYPTLKGMAPLDAAMFREHLKKVHGLVHEIQQ